jgi:uncharacterized damage-inducible protein DinB
MEMIEHLNRQLAYNTWANRVVLRSLLAARTVPERASAVMAHLIGAEWLWLRRLGHRAAPIEVWPALPLTECEGQLLELLRAWQVYLVNLSPDSLGHEIRYTNSKGENWVNTVADILTHVALHSSYHRGQIATLLGRAGEAAAYSDYIECARRRYLEHGWPAQ